MFNQTRLYQYATVLQEHLDVYKKAQGTQRLSATFWDAYDAFVECWRIADLHEAFKIQAVEHTFSRMEQQREIFDQADLPHPTNEFFQAVFTICAVTRQWKNCHMVPHVMRPLAELQARGMSYESIAKQYGWVDEYGNPETFKVLQELENKGTHTEGYVHPAEKKRRRLRAAIDDWLQQDAKYLEMKPDVSPEQTSDAPAFSTIQEAFELGVPPTEAAAVLGLDEDDIATSYGTLQGTGVETETAVDPSEPEWAQGMSDEAIKEMATSYEIAVGRKKRTTLVKQVDQAMSKGGA